MKAEYFVQIGLSDNQQVELATRTDEAHRVYEIYEQYLNGSTTTPGSLSIEGITKYGGKTRTLIRSLDDIVQLSIVEMTEPPVAPRSGIVTPPPGLQRI